ncbi:SurA N-terminal domain-containing protein [Bacteroidota bacterium]
MAIITKIREKSGLAVGIVALGLMLFIVGGDIMGPNSVLLGKNKAEVGEIAGETIKREELQNQIEELKYNYTLNFGRNPTEGEMVSIRQQAWDYLIVKIAFQKQFDEIGLIVTEDEIVDMVQGNNIHPDLMQAFTNPQTGEFNRDQIVSYLQNISRMTPQQQAGWYMFENNLAPSRLRLKYDNLLIKTTYVTEEEAKQQYQQENSVAEVKYIYVPHYTITDSLIDVTDSDLRKYLNENKNEYRVENSRSISYITFPIHPSSEDTLYYSEEMEELRKQFETVNDDSIFARINTDGNDFYSSVNIGSLPQSLKDINEELENGQVIGPEMEGGNLVVHKVADIYEDSIFHARASHILFRADITNPIQKAEVLKKAQDLLREIRNGADFALMARQNSEDGSATAGGDLGWFDENRMVEPFSNAVFSATREGLINRVVESEFGYHLIKVTALKTKKMFKIATIEREIIPSDLTRDEAFRKADYFASRSVNYEEFERNAAADSLTIQDAEGIGINDLRITGLGDARGVIRWAYADAVVGEVSDVFELDNQYVIMVLTGREDEGFADLEDVRSQIEIKVKNQAKGDVIIERLQKLEGTLDEISDAYGDDANVYSSPDLKLNSNSLPSVGFAPNAVGIAFSLKDGQRSAPIKETDGIVIIEMEALTRAPDIADYTIYANQVEQRRNGRVSYLVSEAIRENANIIDERYRFF